MGEIHRIPKRGRNEHFKYDYATESDLADAVRGLLAARHIMLIPAIESVSRDGKLTTVAMTFTFHDGDTGEILSFPWAGCGEDSADKGLWKALTGAVKYVISKTFLIPTGDDPEQDSEQTQKRNGKPAVARPPFAKPAAGPSMALISQDQAKRFFAIAKEHGWKKPELQSLLKRVLKVESSKDIPTYRYDEICKLLEAGVDAMAATQ